MWTPFLIRRRVARIARGLLCVLATAPIFALSAPAQGHDEILAFEPNLGNLRLYQYIPEALPAGRPLVVVLHGCRQRAASFARDTGWIALAEELELALLLPEQQQINNQRYCFNWFQISDQRRAHGEPASIKAGVDLMIERHDVDPARVYVVGLSAGAGMATVLLAAYPDVFAAGAPVAGPTYQCAIGFLRAFDCMEGDDDRSAGDLAKAVRGAFPEYQGPWPRVSVWQGGADERVAPRNGELVAAQWLAVHELNPDSGQAGPSNQVRQTRWTDGAGTVVVELNRLDGFGHAFPIDPETDCGTAGDYVVDGDVCAARQIARFWGLLD